MSKKTKVELLRTKPITAIYADYAYIESTFYGIKLAFGSGVTPRAAGQVLVELEGIIGMSAEHAQDLHRLLGEQLETYRQKHGEIRTGSSNEVAGTDIIQ